MKEFYDSAYAKKKTYRKLSPAKWLRERKIISLLKKHKSRDSGNLILDVGCGQGSLLKQLAKKFSSCQIYGSEYTENLVKANKENFPNINFQVLDLEDPSWQCNLSQNFDIVTCQEVIEHLSPEAQERLVNNIYSILKKNGVLIITTPEKESIKKLKKPEETYEEFAIRFEQQPVANHLSFNQLQDILNASNFEILSSSVVGPYVQSRILTLALSSLCCILPETFEESLIEKFVNGRYQVHLARKLNLTN